MEKIVRKNGEDIKSFIERICQLRASVDEDFDFDFGNNRDLNTRAYKNMETMAEEIERDFNTMVNVFGDDFDIDEEEVFAENVHDEDVIAEETVEEDSQDVDDTVESEESFEENITEEENEQTLISTISLESLHLLTQVAMKDGNYPKIDLGSRKDFEKELEEEKASYEALLAEKKSQIKEIKKKIFDDVHKRGKKIKEQMDLIMSEKKECITVLNEFKVELENFEKGIAELREKIEKGELSQEIIDVINKSKILEDESKILKDEKVKTSDLTEFLKYEELQEIYKLKWNVEAYQEYIDFFYNKNEVNRINSSVEVLKKSAEAVKEDYKALMLELLPGAKMDENGKIDYDVERDDIDLISMREHILLLEEQIKEQDKHPVIIEDKILALMYERKTPEEITPLLDELMSNVKSPVITESFESDKERLDTVNSEIEEVSEKLEALRTLMADNEPLNEDKINIDNIRIERMKAKSEELAREIEKCDVVLAKRDNKSRIENLNDTINKYNLFMLKNIQEKNLYISNNGEKENDPQIAIFDQNIEFAKKTIVELKELRKELREENKANKLFMTVKQAENKKEKLLAEKAKVDKSIEELDLDRQKKIDTGKYIDTRVVNKRKKEMLALEEELDFLNSLKVALGNYKTEKLRDNVLNYNNPEYFEDRELDEEEKFEENLPDTEKEETVVEENTSEEEIFEENIHESDLEEIIEEKPAKKGLLAFIKTNKFKKMAAAALTVIVTGVIAITGMIGHHKNKEAKEDIKEIGIELENVTEDTKVPEIMETVAKVEKERIEVEKEDEKDIEKSKDIVDTTRIADDKYDAARGNFVHVSDENKQYYQNQMIQDIIDMEADGKTVHAIVGHDGTIVGYTDVVNEVEQTGKVR